MEPNIKIRRVDFYPTEWLEGTISLTHIERSVYITICAAIFAQGGPVEIAHVRKLCPGRGFKKGLEGLVNCGKVTREGTLLRQCRALKEVELAHDRIQTARTNGGIGGRPINGLVKPPGFFSENPDRKPNHQPPKKKSLTSTVVPPSARAYVQREAAVHARGVDAPGEEWKTISSLDRVPLSPQAAKIQRAGEHYFFLVTHGIDGEAVGYLESLDPFSHLPPDEIFNAVEARMIG